MTHRDHTPLRAALCGLLCATILFPLQAAEVVDDFSNTNNLTTFGGALSLSAEDNVLTAQRTAANVDAGFDWRVDWFFSLEPSDDQSQFQLGALQSLNGGYFVVNVLVFDNGDYLGEFNLQGDINATGTFGYDIAAAALAAGHVDANQWFPRIRITPFGSDDAGLEFQNFGAVASAATTITSGTLTVNTNTSFGSGTVTVAGGSQLLVTQSRSITNALAVDGSGILNVSSGQTATYSGGISNDGSTLIFAGAGGAHTIDGPITGAAAGSDVAVDGTTVTLNAQSTHNGSTYIYGGGTLVLGIGEALPAGTALVIGAGASAGNVDLDGFDQTVASLATDGSAGGNSVMLGGATLTVSGTDSTVFAGIISGDGSLVKSGTSTLTLAGSTPNTFTGTTTVTGGTLNLAKDPGTDAIAGALTVQSGATLLISANEQIADGPGSSVTLSGGTILRSGGVSETFGDLVLLAESTLDFGNGEAGTLAFGTYTPDNITLVINNFTEGNTLTFESNLTSSITDTNLFSFTNGGLGGYSWDGESGTFTITAIPEASTLLAAVLVLAAFLLLPRRRPRTP